MAADIQNAVKGSSSSSSSCHLSTAALTNRLSDMAKKTSSRKSLKTLFSRTEADQDESAQKEQDRKKFKFPKFRMKSKNEAQRQQEIRTAESRTPAEDREADRIVSVKKSSSVFAKESRAKAKEFSYSELDLRKPKRFATFSFDLRKRKKRVEENISKSTFGLHSSGINMQEETPASCLDLDQANSKMQFSVSQPELDTSGTFNIPSPPPLSSNRSEAYFSFPVGSFLTPKTQLESDLLLSNSCAEGTPRAPIASIQELHLEDSASSVEESAPAQTQTSSAVPSFQSKQAETAVDPDFLQSYTTSAASGSSASSYHQTDNTSGKTELILQNSGANRNVSDAAAPLSQESAPKKIENQEGFTLTVTSEPQTVVLTSTVSEEQRTKPSRQDSTAPLSESLAVGEAEHQEALTVTESLIPEPDPGTSSVSSKQISAERSDPESDSMISPISAEPTHLPISQDLVYEAFYDSLFPLNFTSEVIASLLQHPSQIPARLPAFQTESTEVQRPPESPIETDKTRSLQSHDPAAGFFSSGEINPTCAPSAQTSSSSRIQVPYSELTASHSHSRGLVPDSAASPVSGTSPGTDSRVSCAKRRVILVRQSLTPVSSPPDHRMNTQEVETQMENFFVPTGPTDGSDRALSPAYLSVGSDEGSTMEVYFSAQEDNTESGEEEMFTVDEREKTFVPEEGREMQLQGEDTQQVGGGLTGGTLRGEAQTRIEEITKGHRLEDQLLFQGNSECILGPNPRIEEKGETNSAQVRGKAEEERREELLAPPVQQVNKLMECDSTPPSSDPSGEGNQAEDVETDDLSDEEQKALSLQGKFLISEVRRPEETGEELCVQAREGEERTFSSNTCSAAGQIPDAAGATRSPEWADTMTKSADGIAATQQQVSDKLPAPDTRTLPPDLHPAKPTSHLDHGFQYSGAEPEPEPDDRMSSSFSSLSTKLTLKNSSPPKEEEPKPCFHKVSLVGTETSSISEQTDPEPEYRFKNCFHGVTQYKSSRSFLLDSSDTSSALPEDAPYTHISSSSSAPSSLTDSSVYLSPVEVGEWRRSLLEEEEQPAAPASEGEERLKGETEWRKSKWELEQLTVSSCSTDDDSCFTGVFRATLVDLVSDPAPSLSPPSSPGMDSAFNEMDILVDTLKSMEPSQRPRSTSLRAAPPVLVSPLPPIKEDMLSPIISDPTPSLIRPPLKTEEPQNQPYTLLAGLGLKKNTSRDNCSLLELMKKSQEHISNLPNGNGAPQSPTTSSRLNGSILFGNYRSLSVEQKLENGNTEPLCSHTRSLPETGSSGMTVRESGKVGPLGNTTGSRVEHLSFVVNSSSLGSMNGSGDSSFFRTSCPASLSLGSPTTNIPTSLLSPTGSINLHRPLTNPEPHLFSQGPGVLQRSLSCEGLSQTPQFSSLQGSPQFSSLQGSPRFSSLQGSPRFSSLQGSPQFSSLQGGPQFSSLQGGPQFSSLQGGPQFSSLQGGPQFCSLQGSPQFSSLQGGPQFSSLQGGPQFSSLPTASQFQSQQDEPDFSLMSKYRAFPDAYLTKEKDHGKLNPRPGKMYIFDRPGMCGQRMEIHGDIIDATTWELQETISIRVVRGGWVLYEKPNFKGEKIALDEGDVELTCPFRPPEEQLQNGQKEDHQKEKEQNGEMTEEQTRKFIIGSVRRAVRDYSVPEICLFPEEKAEGKKVIFRDTSEDARIFGFPIKANSIIVNAGLWLVFAQPFFQGVPRILEVGGYSNPTEWGVENPHVASVHPLKMGEPRVENMREPKMVIYEKPYFTGKSRTITSNMRDFLSRTDRQQTVFLGSLGSLKVLGGIWVGYEKEGFRGHQYLLEEGEYHDWRVWGGCDLELRSVRIICADLTDPMMTMFEQPEEEDGVTEEKPFDVTEAIPDVELFQHKTSTRSIYVLSGLWIAYSHVDFSGNQYILEKGFYNNCADWGSLDTRVCSVQPILPAPADASSTKDKIILYSEPDFQGECLVFHHSQGTLSDKFMVMSCQVVRGSWVLCENKQFSGNMYVLTEEDYPSLTSMGCPSSCSVLSIKLVPMTLSVPSISLFGLEGLEGREITTESEVISLVRDGFNNHILSVRVNSGSWVVCEHSNYRGRQFLLEPIEITNWPKFSSLQRIGSMYPIRQKRYVFRVKNNESGHFLSVQGVGERFSRVVVKAKVEPQSDIWFYQDGLIKNKLSTNMCLHVMGSVEPAAKVVLWNESHQSIQTWSVKMKGLISSLTFPGMVLDVKGGQNYDKEHLVVMPENDESPSQQWEIQLL
ncbi:beta/gamma crystallin domain-containing protein 1-like [Girardinichthys multiradiatus]|uniref:beta/gamma crystallin domain-containing protein 1-like n=1 Tax=Girardinichthys multiradiatus TaxID=208333 RepID=UPI001FAD8A23|nr:beta/gamma crystallin domain-containing protein 1-like [Girardinichthys multiradiatus]